MTDIAMIREALTDPEIASYPDFTGAVSAALDEIETLRAALREYVCDCTGPCHAETYGGACGRAAFAALNPPPQPNVAGDIADRSTLRNFAIEACAALIEKNIIMDTSAGKVLSPRQDGNRDGLHYAAAIRALATTECSDNA